MAKRTEKAQGEQLSLTPKQESFVAVYMETGNATEAYRQSYDCAAMKDPTINRAAKELLDNPKIAARVGVLRERVAAKVVLSRAWVLEQLMDNVGKAKVAADFTASNKALELLGKTDELQMFVERANVTSDNRHHHSAEPLSPFAQHLAEVLGAGAEGSAEGSVPN